MSSAYFGRDRIFSIRSSFLQLIAMYEVNNKGLKSSPCSIPVGVLKYLLNALLNLS